MGHHDDMDDDDEYECEEESGHPMRFISGLLMGGLIGVSVGILLAPAPGETTRHRLRDQAVSARDEALQRADEAREKAKELEASSRDMLEAQKRRVLRTAEAVKQSAQEAWTAKDNTSAAATTAGNNVGANGGGAKGGAGTLTPRS